MDTLLDALVYVLAYNFGAGLLAFFGAFRGVFRRRKTMITPQQGLAVFTIGWLAGAALVFLVHILAYVFGFAITGIWENLVSLVVLFFIMRKMIERYEQRAGYPASGATTVASDT